MGGRGCPASEMKNVQKTLESSEDARKHQHNIIFLGEGGEGCGWIRTRFCCVQL